MLENNSENSENGISASEETSVSDNSELSDIVQEPSEHTDASSQDEASSPPDSPTTGDSAPANPSPVSQNPDGREDPDDQSRYAYLTFDDGPSRNTEAILQILEENDIKATFFVTGHTDENSMQRYRMIADAGHTLAMHSYTHNYAEIYASAEAFLADYERISTLLEEITGVRPTMYRFPGGSSNTLKSRHVTMTELIGLLQERGIEYYDWNVNSTDASGRNPDPNVLTQSVASGLKYKHNIILMHDAAGHETTVQALPGIIQECRDRGLIFSVITQDTPPAHHNRID